MRRISLSIYVQDLEGAGPCLYGGHEVGFLEIIPLEKQGFAGDLGKCIGEAVAKIQPGRMAALAEVVEGLAREMRLLNRERLNDDAGSAEKHIALAEGLGTDLTFDDDGSSRKFAALIRQRFAP
jgi:hypothetical protein